MCGVYRIPESKFIAKKYGVKKDVPEYEAGKVHIGTMAPVVMRDGNDLKIERMKWGLLPVFSKDAKDVYKYFNARSERIDETFYRQYAKNRVLIPATSFWERHKETKKMVEFKTEREVFAFAGLFSVWKDPKSEDEIKTFTMLTTVPSEIMFPVHERQPLILTEDEEDSWLGGEEVVSFKDAYAEIRIQ